MNPLEAIKQWYNTAPDNMKEELVQLIQYFHIDPSVNTAFAMTYLSEFEKYLDSSSLENDVIVRRAIAMKGLITYGLRDKDTVEKWEDMRRRHMKMSERKEDFELVNTVYDTFNRTYENRKNNWIQLCNSWKMLLENAISDQQISNWYFSSDPITSTLMKIGAI